MNRRLLLTRIVQAFSITGIAFVTYPFLKAWIPAFGRDISMDVNVKDLLPGESKTIHWLGRNLYIHRRTMQAIEILGLGVSNLKDPESRHSRQPEFAENPYRSLRPGIFVVYSNCTHLGCEVVPDGDRFKCPCHESEYDAAGRVTDGAAAPDNLEVPSYRYISANIIRLEEADT